MKKGLKTSKNLDFYFSVYNRISEGRNPSQIAKQLHISKQKINYYIRRLKDLNSIKKVGYGTWEAIAPPTQKEVKKDNPRWSTSFIRGYPPPPKSKNQIRSHAFMWHLSLKNIQNWSNRSLYLRKLGISYRRIHSNGQSLTILDRKVHLFTNSVMVYDTASYISSEVRKNRSTAVNSFLKIIKKLESILKVDLSYYQGKYRFRVLREHHSLLENSLAKQYNEHGRKLNIYNEHGLWLLIDNSYNLNELEIIKNRHPDPNHSLSDTEGVQNWFNSLQRTDYKVTPEYILTAINQVTQNQLIFADNMKTHISAIQELSLGVQELRETIKRINETTR